MLIGMKKRDRKAHVELLDIKWSYWNKMTDDQLRQEYLEGRLSGDIKKDKDLAAKANKWDRATLIHKLVVRHVQEMI